MDTTVTDADPAERLVQRLSEYIEHVEEHIQQSDAPLGTCTTNVDADTPGDDPWGLVPE